MTKTASKWFVVRVCLVATLGGLLFGYDTAVISGTIGFLQEHFHLSAALKGWAASSALLGCAVGVSMAGFVNDLSGRKNAQMLSGILCFASAVGRALAGSFTAFIVFRIMGGGGVGIASMTAPMYIAEISPAKLRGRLVAMSQLAIVSGILAIYFVNYFIARGGDDAWNAAVGWRWMFASGALPSALFLLLLPGFALAVLQQATGINVFLHYAPEIFKQLGAATDAALLQTIVVGGVNLASTLIAMAAVDRLGRKPLMNGIGRGPKKTPALRWSARANQEESSPRT